MYRCLRLHAFRRAAVASDDVRYLMVPSFGPFACTILAEIAKLNVFLSQQHAEEAALCVAMGSCLSIYGTILNKAANFRPWYQVYNLTVTLSVFLYMMWLNE